MDIAHLLEKDPRDLSSMAGLLGVHAAVADAGPTMVPVVLEALIKRGRVAEVTFRGIVESVGGRERHLRFAEAGERSRVEAGRIWTHLDSEDAEPFELRIPAKMVASLGLRVGDEVKGVLYPPEPPRPLTVSKVLRVNGKLVSAATHRRSFERLKTSFPKRRITLERADAGQMAAVGRIVDLIAPLGFGQRALVVAPPRTGKTILLSEIAKSVEINHPEAELMVLLIDERPEEVAFMRQSLSCPIFFSTFDQPPKRHVRLAELVTERAKRLVEHGRDVVIVMDSLTRLARAYNTLQPSSGKILTGGIDAASLDKPKRLFGAARAVEGGGSLTIVATALVDTGSRGDQVHYEELKGTGSSEIVLDRRLAEKGTYPAIDILASGTRMDDALYSPDDKRAIDLIRRFVKLRHPTEATEWLVDRIGRTGANAELLRWIITQESQAPRGASGPRIASRTEERLERRPLPGAPAGYGRVRY